MIEGNYTKMIMWLYQGNSFFPRGNFYFIFLCVLCSGYFTMNMHCFPNQKITQVKYKVYTFMRRLNSVVCPEAVCTLGMYTECLPKEHIKEGEDFQAVVKNVPGRERQRSQEGSREATALFQTWGWGSHPGSDWRSEPSPRFPSCLSQMQSGEQTPRNEVRVAH